jgi:hypothetical protein
MAEDPSRKLNQRSHRGGFNHGPVIIVIPTDLCYRGAQHDKKMICFRENIQITTNIGIPENLKWILASENFVKTVFDR